MENYKQKKIINKSILNILWYYLVSVLGASIISLVLSFIPGLKEDIASGNLNLYMLLTNLLTYALIMVILYLINRTYLNEDIKRFSDHKKHYFFLILIGFISVYAANIVLSSLYQLAGLNESVNQQAIVEVVSSGHYYLSFFFMVLFGPITEEIIFRYSFINLISYGLKKTKLTEIKKLYLANVVSSLFFGLIHVLSGGDFIFLPLYMALGLVIGIFYIKSNRNIWVSSGIHILNNFVAFLGMVALGSLGA